MAPCLDPPPASPSAASEIYQGGRLERPSFARVHFGDFRDGPRNFEIRRTSGFGVSQAVIEFPSSHFPAHTSQGPSQEQATKPRDSADVRLPGFRSLPPKWT